MLRIESSAFSALPSWMKPSSALRMTTPKMIAASSHRLEHQLGEAGAEQHIDQNVVELGQEPHERPPLLAFRQPVWPILLQAVRRFGRIQTPPGVGGETFRHLVHGHTMPGYGVGCGIGVRCSAHWCAP